MNRLQRIVNFLHGLVDEAHEQAAFGLFLTALGLELFTAFDDFATLGVLLLACVTLFGSKRYQGFRVPNLGGLRDHLPKAPADELEDQE